MFHASLLVVHTHRHHLEIIARLSSRLNIPHERESAGQVATLYVRYSFANEESPGSAIVRGSMPLAGVTFKPDKSGVGSPGKLGRPTEGRLTEGSDRPPPLLLVSAGLGAGGFF